MLAVSAQTRNTVNYTVMRTSRGDLIDSSPVERVRLLDGKHDDVDQVLAKACATVLSNPDEQAIADISALGFGGIYVVADTQSDADTVPYDQLSTNTDSRCRTPMPRTLTPLGSSVHSRALGDMHG